jgi:predicted DNA-binding transcriptional regulator AlpA
MASDSMPRRESGSRPRPRLAPAGLRGPDAARYVGISPAAWTRLVAAGRTPAPIRLGGCVLWSRHDLIRWLLSGAPDRAAYQAMLDAAKRGPRR